MSTKGNKKHIIGALVENEAGALSRVVGLFSQRGYNIESLTVAPTADNSLSRLTLTTDASADVIEQIAKQLNKIVPVYKVLELSETEHVEREVLLIKVRAQGEYRSEIWRLVEIFGGRVIDTTPSTYIIEVFGRSSKLNAFLETLDNSRILEMARSGVVSITSGARAIAIEEQKD
ncbi:MAG: acetolactate synthase small subunit [Candidatus Portiera sp.]|nr:acetolactate synthase small subunit [Portiera sp.]